MYGEARSVEVEVEGLGGKDFSLRAEGLGVWDGLSPRVRLGAHILSCSGQGFI